MLKSNRAVDRVKYLLNEAVNVSGAPGAVIGRDRCAFDGTSQVVEHTVHTTVETPVVNALLRAVLEDLHSAVSRDAVRAACAAVLEAQ